jgi:hypothetical protein
MTVLHLPDTISAAAAGDNVASVTAEQPGMLRRVQRLADATVWPVLLDGCRTSRDTAAGFVIDTLDRFRFPPTGPTSPAAPHVRGTATTPAQDGNA